MVSTTGRQESFKQKTDEIWLSLVQIDHADLAQPFRMVNNTEDVTSNGNVYTAFPFELILPAQSDADTPAKISICNVDVQMAIIVRSIEGPPSVTLSVVLHSSPDVVEYGPFVMEMYDVSYDQFVLTGSLRHDSIIHDRYPKQHYDNINFPGLF